MSISTEGTRTRQALDAASRTGDIFRANHQRLQGWTALLERVVRIITGNGTHRVLPTDQLPNGAVAATDGQDIFLSTLAVNGRNLDGSQVGDLAESVLRLKGLVYHELGHILYTPRIDGPLRTALAYSGSPEAGKLPVTKLGREHLMRTWNVLEDGRMEDLFVKRFPRARDYFASVVYGYILGHPQASTGNKAGQACLIIGRTHLPQDVRAQARGEAASRLGAAKAQQLFDAIKKFSDPRSSWIEQGKAVIEVAELVSPPSDTSHQLQSAGSQGGTGGGEPQDGDSVEPGGDDPGVGTGDLRKAVRKAQLQIKENGSLRNEVDQTIRALKAEESAAPGIGGHGITGGNDAVRPPTSDEILVSHNVRESLAQLLADTAPATHRRQPAGRLNTGRYLDPHRQVYELDYFDRKDDFAEGLDTEIVFLLDVSGSMNSLDNGVTRRIDQAAGVLWAIQKAAQDIDVTTTVLTFHDGEPMFWKGGSDRIGDEVRTPGVGGGTNPTVPLVIARDFLEESTAAHKLIVTITDGQWSGDQDAYRVVFNDLRDLGINTLSLGIFGGDVEQPGRGEDVAINVPRSLDVARAVQTSVDSIVRNGTHGG